MKITTKKNVTTIVETEIQIPSFRKSKREYSKIIEVFAIISDGKSNTAISAYDAGNLIMLTKQTGSLDTFLNDFIEAEEITEAEFKETYDSIKAKL